MPDVRVSLVTVPPGGAGFPVSFCPVEVYAMRASAQVPSRPRGGSQPTVVQAQRVAVIQGRTTDLEGSFVLTDADRAPFQPGDQVFVQATLSDPAAITVKRFAGSHQTYVLHLRMDNPADPGFLQRLIFADRGSDTRLLPLSIEPTVDARRSSIPNAGHGRDAATVYTTIARMNRWFTALGTTAAALGHVEAHFPNPTLYASYYDSTVRRIVIDTTGAVRAVVAHEYGHHIFKVSQPGYDPPGGDHRWFGRSGGRGSTAQRGVDFSEAYATFCALNHLRRSQYADVDPQWRWTIELDAETMHGAAVPASGAGHWGDGPTAGYLYDLTDEDEPFFTSREPGARLEYREAADAFSKPFREIHDHFIAWGRGLGAGVMRTADRFHRYLKETAYPGERLALDMLWTRNLPGADIPGTPAIPGWVQPSAAQPAH